MIVKFLVFGWTLLFTGTLMNKSGNQWGWLVALFGLISFAGGIFEKSDKEKRK